MSRSGLAYYTVLGLLAAFLAACPLPAPRVELDPSFLSGQDGKPLRDIHSLAVLPGAGKSPHVREATAYFTFLLEESGRYKVIWPYSVEQAYAKSGRALEVSGLDSKMASEAGRLTGADAVVYLIFDSRENPGEYAASWMYTWAAASLIDSSSGAFIANTSISEGTYTDFAQAENASRKLYSVFYNALSFLNDRQKEEKP